MDPNSWSNFVVLLTICVCSASADDTITFHHRLEATEELVKALSHRVDLLESRENVHLHRIDELEARAIRQQETIDELEKRLQEHRTHSEHLVGAFEDNRTYDVSKPSMQIVSESIANTSTRKRDRAVQRIRQADVESPIAFLALIGNHFDQAGVKQIIVFERVVTNIGTAYNPSIGIFSAPLEGVYVFSTTLVAHGQVDAHASFYRNADVINVMYINPAEAGWVTSSTITLHLQKGDIVTVRNGDISNGAYYGANHSSFSGFLLSSYANGQSVIGK